MAGFIAAPWMSTASRGCTPAWPVESAWPASTRIGVPQPDCGVRSVSCSMRAGGPVSGSMAESWGRRRRRAAAARIRLNTPSAPSDRRRPGNNAAGAPFWNVKRVDTGQSDRGTKQGAVTARAAREAATPFQGNQFIAVGRAAAGCCRGRVVGYQRSSTCPYLSSRSRPYTQSARRPSTAEQQREPAQAGRKLAHHPNEGRAAPTPPSTNSSKAGAGWRRPGRKKRSRRVQESPVSKPCQPVVAAPTEEPSSTSSAGLGEVASTQWCVLGGGPQEEHQPTSHQQVSKEGWSLKAGGMRRADKSPHPGPRRQRMEKRASGAGAGPPTNGGVCALPRWPPPSAHPSSSASCSSQLCRLDDDLDPAWLALCLSEASALPSIPRRLGWSMARSVFCLVQIGR